MIKSMFRATKHKQLLFTLTHTLFWFVILVTVILWSVAIAKEPAPLIQPKTVTPLSYINGVTVQVDNTSIIGNSVNQKVTLRNVSDKPFGPAEVGFQLFNDENIAFSETVSLQLKEIAPNESIVKTIVFKKAINNEHQVLVLTKKG